MRKKILALLLILTVLIMPLSACGRPGSNSGDSSGSGSESEEAPIPVGLYMFAYFCNADGEYVADLNEEPDYYGYPSTELERMYDDKETYWVSISEDGTGEYHDIFNDSEELSIDREEHIIWYGDIFHEYIYDEANDAYWYGSDDFWYYMRSCTQDELDRVFEGKGGSVPVSEAEVGDKICFGTYDTNPYNEETEHLYWRVIDKQDGKILVLCDKLIDAFSFNYNPEAANLDKVTWENSSVRAFLNNEFLQMMFTQEEQALVQTTVLENKAANTELLEQWGDWEDRDGIPYSTQTRQIKQDDPDTEDKVFLLSYQEILKYLGEPTEEYDGDGGYPFTAMEANSGWKALVTQSVDYNAVGYYDIDTRYGAWMTRTLSTAADTDEMLVVYITSEGQVYNYYTYTPMFIRPAMWISAEGTF